MELQQKRFALFAEVIAGCAITILLPITLYQGVQVFMPETDSVKKAREEIESLKAEATNIETKRNLNWQEIERLNVEIKESSNDQARSARQNELTKKQEMLLELKRERQAITDKYTKIENDIVRDWMHKKHQATFATLLIAGALLIVLGLVIKTLLGSLFVFGGGLSIAISYILYWDELTNLIAFISLLMVLIILSTVIWYFSRKK